MSESELDLRVQLAGLGADMSGDALELFPKGFQNLRQIIELTGPHVVKVKFLDNESNCDDRHCEMLCRVVNLSELRVMGCKRLTDGSFHYFSKLNALRTLDLSEWTAKAITPAGLKLLARCRQLEMLRLPPSYYWSTERDSILKSRQGEQMVAYLQQHLPHTAITGS